MLPFLLALSQVLLFGSCKLSKFGFATSSDRHAGSTGVINTTLWFNRTIFSCELRPKVENDWYICEETAQPRISAAWRAVESDPVCNEPQYKIMMDNSQSTDPVIISNVGFWTKTPKGKESFYVANQFCIPNGVHTTFPPVGGFWTVNMCNSTHQPHDKIVISAGPLVGMSPKQIIFFDIRQNNHATMNALWQDATNVVGEPLICTTASPTEDPTEVPTLDPTVSPTKPTRAPSTDPTPFPTKDPTRAPSNNPTRSPTDDPTLSPTEKPTSSPSERPTPEPSTRFPTRSPVDEVEWNTFAPTNQPSFEPSMNPFHSSIKPSAVSPHIVSTDVPPHYVSISLSSEAEIRPTEIEKGNETWGQLEKKYMRYWPIAAGGVALICICVAVLSCIRKKKKKKKYVRACTNDYVQLTMGTEGRTNSAIRKADTAGTQLDAYDL